MIGSRRGLLAAMGGTLVASLPARNAKADAKVRVGEPGKPAPDLVWTLADGTERRLAEYRGQGVVLNLWATWCVPCVAEMPSLDALAKALEGTAVVVLPLSSDQGGAAAVERFYTRTGVQNLPVLLDRRAAAARLAGVNGIPTTLLIDAAGRERGRLEGAADWADAASVAMVKRLAG